MSDVITTPAIEPAPTGHPLRRLLPFVLTARRDVGWALGASVIGQAAGALAPLVQRTIVDGAISSQPGAVAPWLVVLVVIAVLSFGLAYVRRWVGGRISLTVQHHLRTAIFERLMRLDFAGHEKLRTGQLVSRASSDLGLIQQLLAFLPIMLGNVVLLVIALVAMTILSPTLTLVMAGALPVMAIVALRLRTTVFPASWDAQQRAGEVAGVVDEAVTGVRVVKGFGAEQREIDRLTEAATTLYRARLRLVRLQARTTSSLGAVPALAQVAVLALGGWLALRDRLSLGTYLAFSAYLVQLVPPVRMMALVVAAVQQAKAGAERVLDILDANTEIQDPPDPVDPGRLRGDVRLEDVRFGYRRSEPVLDGLTLHVRAGETVALVGGSGSGKSTVTALLPRFYDPLSGQVLIDGHDVRSLSLTKLRAQVGVVFEEAFLFSDTVRANIAYGRPDVTDADVRAAARIADAEGFIDALPDGFDTVVGERGLTLSGGQRQRIALARAVVSDPAVLILDDATSAVDTATEESIHAALRAVMAGRTTLLVAHRASTVRLADRVVLLDAGKAVAVGTHEELLATDDRYRAMLGEGELSELGAVVPDEPPDERGITPLAWPTAGGPSDGPGPGPTTTVPRTERYGGRAGAGAGGGNFGANLAGTPQLLAALDRLPEFDDEPEVEPQRFVEPPGEPFSLLRFIRPWRRPLAVGLGFVAADAVLTALGPVLIRHGIDGVRRDAADVLRTSVIAYAVVVLVDWAAMWAGAFTTGRTAERILFALRLRIFGHLQRLSLDFYDAEMDGRVMTRMTSDVEALSQLVQTGLVTAVVGFGTCMGVAVFLVILSPPLALATASVLPFLALATWAYQRWSSRAYRDAREAIASVNANLQENLSGVRVAQAYGREDRNAAGFRAVSGTYLSARLRAQRLLALYFPGIGLLADLAGVIVLGTGAAFVADGRVDTPTVIAFVLYLNLFFAPIQQLSQVFDTWQQARAATTKITELLTTPSGTPPPAVPIEPGRLRGEITFDHVHHSYPGAVAESLHDVSLVIRPGETVALVGETGAGKSTVVRLIARFHDPTMGGVRVDGIDLREIDLTAYRHQLGIVPQESFLFTGTVRDNIAYARPEATDAAVEAAARAVGAHRFIAALPQGYRTEVSERGRSLSAGQRQLIALARAQLVEPVILLLDEATANLDLTAEAAVRDAMAAVARPRTTVLVAHRLPTARSADRIVVLDSGRVAEIGTHDELITAEGAYARLWAAHLGHPA